MLGPHHFESATEPLPHSGLRTALPAASSDEQARQAAMPALPSDDWRLESELRYVERLASTLHGVTQSRVDGPHSASAGPRPASAPAASPHLQPHSPAGTPSAARPSAPAPRGGLAAWLALSLGVMTLMCGGVLLACSFLPGREALRNYGLAGTAAGQGLLILGLVLQLDRFRQASQEAEQSLSQLDHRLDHLQQTAELLASSRTAPAQSFYAHLSAGASPSLLVADLKGQLDLLTQRLTRDGR